MHTRVEIGFASPSAPEARKEDLRQFAAKVQAALASIQRRQG
jgi:hypothetical protein